MKQLTFLFFLVGIQPFWGQSDRDANCDHKITIHSHVLNEDRVCLLQLPDTYSSSDHTKKKYPVLILLDGYTFFKTTSGIVHFMSSERNRNYLMPETIIVAIENVDRERDFTVSKIKTKRPNTMGGGKQFLDFIEKELIPHLDKNYRTVPHRTLVGHSLGGLLTLNAYTDANSIFDAFLSIDPSIWWDEEMMKNKVDSIAPEILTRRLYLATANQGEANYERNKKRHDLFFELLKNITEEPLNFKLEYFENESHRSLPLVALYEGLKYLNKEHL